MRVAKWRAANPETSKESCRNHYARNREAILAQKRDYYQRVRKVRDATPEGRLKDLNRKHLRRSREGGRTITMPEWLAILDEHNHACAYCKSSGLPLEIDHVIPLSKGGKHCPSNIVPACKPCNSSTGAR
jgi:5-methylcytosine-specific restriction endonuclease McrA